MALIKVELSFPNINQSVQVGDTAYYTTWENNNNGFATGTSNFTSLGSIINIIGNTITVEFDDSITVPTAQSFIFFSKDNTANMASMLGYYGEVEFKNDSKEYAELFATACEISESSK